MRGREWRENGLEWWIPLRSEHLLSYRVFPPLWSQMTEAIDKTGGGKQLPPVFPPPRHFLLQHSLSFSQHIQRCSDEYYRNKRAEVNYFQSHWLATMLFPGVRMKTFLQGWLTVFFSCECEIIGIYLKFIFFKCDTVYENTVPYTSSVNFLSPQNNSTHNH